MITVEAEHVSYRLNNPDYDVDYFTMNDTPTNILTAILADTDFTVGTIEFVDKETFSLQEATSRRALLMQFAAYVGGELEFDGFTISLLTHRGSATPKALTVGKDITVISKAVNKRVVDNLGNPTVAYFCGVYKGADLDLGDVVTLDYDALDIDVSLRVVAKNYDPYNPNNISVEIGNCVNALEDDLYRIETSTVAKGKAYYGTTISAESGLVIEKIDGETVTAKVIFNSDTLAMQALKNGVLVNSVYFDTVKKKYIFDGELSVDIVNALSAVITPNLYTEKAVISELTVDQLDTSDKVKNYLASDTSDVNYIRVYDQHIQFITASTDGLTYEQAENRDGVLLYWTNVDREAASTEATEYPVYIYVYTEQVKLDISFENTGANYTPMITLGAGSGTGNENKGYIWKSETGLTIKYVKTGGDELLIELSNDGIIATGNTGAQGLRNIHISDTEPSDPQLNDLWIDTDE